MEEQRPSDQRPRGMFPTLMPHHLISKIKSRSELLNYPQFTSLCASFLNCYFQALSYNSINSQERFTVEFEDGMAEDEMLDIIQDFTIQILNQNDLPPEKIKYFYFNLGMILGTVHKFPITDLQGLKIRKFRYMGLMHDDTSQTKYKGFLDDAIAISVSYLNPEVGIGLSLDIFYNENIFKDLK